MVGEVAGSTTADWPLVVYCAAAVVTVAGTLGLSWLLGERRHATTRSQPYESGIMPTGTARLRLSVGFYLVAVFFVIFDLEAVFVIVWAVSARSAGWSGYSAIVVFIVFLLAAWLYLWREGVLDSRGVEKLPSKPELP